MRRLPIAALIPLSIAVIILLAAVVLGLQPVPKPSWSSEAGTGKAIQMLFCVTPLVGLSLVFGIVSGAIILRSKRR